MNFDLLLKGGHVIDPGNQIDGPANLAITGDRIKAIGQNITGEAKTVIDVSGMYVTPGLIDLHTHSYGYFASTLPDEYSFPNGTTTIIDAGGSGYKNFLDFKTSVIDRARVRLLALLNIVGGGMLGAVEQDISEMQPEPCAETVLAFPETIVGVKAAHHRGPGWQSVDGAVKAAELSNTFAMIDYSENPARSYAELITDHMRPGDVHTHMYNGKLAQIDENSQVYEYVWKARERGVLFDVGHGGGSFLFRVAKPSMDQGHVPDTISTDAHQGSLYMPRATMPITMSKLMNMGMSFPDAVEKSTVAPARKISRPDLGTLSVESVADVAVLDLEKGDFGFVDSGLARMRGNQRITCHITIRGGKVVWDMNGLSRPDWETAGRYLKLD